MGEAGTPGRPASGRAPGSRLAAISVAHPWRTLAVGLVVLLLGGLLGSPVANILTSGGFDDPGAQTAQANRAVLAATGIPEDSSMILLVRPGSDVTAGPGRDLVARVATDLRSQAQVGYVVDPVSTPNPALVSTDHRSAYMVAGILAAPRNNEDVANEVAATMQGRYPQVTAGGYLVAFRQVSKQVSKDLGTAELLAGPILFLVLVLVLRGLVVALLPLAVGGTSVLTSFLLLRGINNAWTLSVFALNLVTGLGLGLAIDYGLLIVNRYREEALDNGYTREALRRTLATAGRTVLFSSLTVAAAAASLLIFPERFLYSMGVGGVVVTTVSSAVALTVLPALLAVLGPRIETLGWFRLERARIDRERHGAWYRIAHMVMRRPVLVAVVTGAVMLALGAPFLRIAFTSVDASVLPESASARQVDDVLRSSFGGDTSQPVHAVISLSTTDPIAGGQVRTLAAALGSLPGARAVSPPRPLDGGTWVVDVLPSQPTLSEPTQALVRAVREVTAREPYPVLVGGQTAQFIDLQSNLRSLLPYAVLIVLSITVAVLWAMTGSVVLPLKAVLMNFLTVSAAFGLLVLIFQDGRLTGLLNYQSQGALESTQPILLYAITFGLSTDYGVILLSRIKEGRDAGLPTGEAVALGLERTGRIVTAAAVLLAIAIGAFATSSIVFIKELGVGSAAGVLIDASIVRALLVPALMKLLGDWNWWSPRPLSALHRRLGLDRLDHAESRPAAPLAA